MYFFYYSGFLSNLRLPWKTESALKFFAVLNIFFIILEFWVTCTCPENRVSLEFFTVLNILLTFRIFEHLALALKNRVALEFFTVLKYILWFRVFEELAVALKTEFTLKIFKHGAAAAPPWPPASYAYGPNNVTNTFSNAVNLLPKDLRLEHWGAKLASCPRRHLSSLHPCLRHWNFRLLSFWLALSLLCDVSYVTINEKFSCHYKISNWGVTYATE